MPEKAITLTVNSEEFKINVAGIGDDIVIEYNADIDVTAFVDSLTNEIDSGDTITVTVTPENLEEKAALVSETIKDIVAKFNEVVLASTADAEGAGSEGTQ